MIAFWLGSSEYPTPDFLMYVKRSEISYRVFHNVLSDYKHL